MGAAETSFLRVCVADCMEDLDGYRTLFLGGEKMTRLPESVGQLAGFTLLEPRGQLAHRPTKQYRPARGAGTAQSRTQPAHQFARGFRRARGVAVVVPPAQSAHPP